jgi:ubiquitin-protein ligase
MNDVRSRRLDKEWELLAMLAEHNPSRLEVLQRDVQLDAEVFQLALHRTSALQIGSPPSLLLSASHRVSLRYPEYFPSVPIEAFLGTPVFHPNVHPENGFVCLWSTFSAGDTIIEAIRQLQRVVTWEVLNDRPEHLMQPAALRWVPDVQFPLAYEPLLVPSEFQMERTYARKRDGSWRRRLSGPES